MITETAKLFATAAHGATGQRRKYTNEPYIVHPIAVAKLVGAHGGTPEMEAAAYLHDVVEDTELEIVDIQAAFGDKIAQMVDALTNKAKPGDGNRNQRFMINCKALIATLDDETRVIKLCDLLHNTSSIVEHDHEFAAVYLAEKKFMLDTIFAGMDGHLVRLVRAQLDWSVDQLNELHKARHERTLKKIWRQWETCQ